MLPSTKLTASALALTIHFGAVFHGLRTPCERFAARVTTGLAHHSVPAGDRPWPGRVRYLQGSKQGFELNYFISSSSSELCPAQEFPDSTVIVVGDSDTLWNGVPLPLDLTFMAMPGCKLLATWVTQVGIFTQNGGTVVWMVTIPNSSALIGIDFYNQAWVLDAAANAQGIATSNGGKGVIGN